MLGALREQAAAPCPALGVFAFLLALAILIEWAPALAALYEPARPPNRPLWHGSLLVCAAAIALLLRPTSTARLLLLSACGAYNVAGLMPGVNNHNFFTLVADLSLLAAALCARLAEGRLSRPALYRALAPLLRIELLVLYFWAFFHKLNRDFFDPEVSCASIQLYQLSSTLPWVPTAPWARVLAIYGTLAIELAIPVLLAIPATRIPGVLLGIGFHSMLGLNYPGFSVLVFAFYTLFVPPALFASRAGTGLQAPAAGLIPASGAGRVFLEACLGLALAAALAVFYAQGLIAGIPKSTASVVIGAALLGFLAHRLLRQPETRPPAALAWRVPQPWLWLVPLLLFANGLAPHLGIKNVQAFAMFSNLRTGGGQSNHWLLPVEMQISRNLSDVVRIQASTDPALDRLTRPGRSNGFVRLPTPRPWAEASPPPRYDFALPYLALRTRLRELAEAEVRGAHVAFERDGQLRVVENAEADAELTGVPWWQRKLLRLRAVPLSERAPCMW